MANMYKLCNECQNKVSIRAFKCTKCGSYDLEEKEDLSVDSAPTASRGKGGISPGVKTRVIKPSTKVQGLKTSPRQLERFATGISELDRVLGGGMVNSEVVLLAASPGAGKSTLCLSVANVFAHAGKKVLYCSGEESVEQIGIRADRIGVDSDNILLVHTSSLEDILGHINEQEPDLFIVDSLQTVASSELSGSIGSIAQSKEAANALNMEAKRRGCRAILVNQVNKSEDFAGSSSIQHVVDAALFIESDRNSPLKTLKAYKNRFGSTEETGLFRHTDKGLEEVPDPSGILTDDSAQTMPKGSAYGVLREGMRTIPVEVQALAITSQFNHPQRKFSGIDFNRGQIIAAILTKFCHSALDTEDIFASTIFGVKVNDPLIDLAVATSILSSSDSSADSRKRTVYVGELTLSGQVRGAYGIDKIVDECDRMGFDRIVVPSSSRTTVGKKSRNIEVAYISDAKDIRRYI